MNLISYKIIALAAVISLPACGPTIKEWTPEKKTAVYSVSFRQTAPQATYNRLRWVNSPAPLPSRMYPEQSGLPIHPIFHLSLQNTPIDEAALILAGTARYASFCPGSNCNRRISIEALGTIDELGEALSKKSGLQFNVDHETRTVRVGGKKRKIKEEVTSPNFYDSGTVQEKKTD